MQTCPIPAALPFHLPPSIRILRRFTLTISDTALNYRFKDLNEPSSGYDILAVRPTDDKTLQQACLNLDCDIISLDLTMRYMFHFASKMLKVAIDRGVRIEICYGPGITAMDRKARKQLIENATAIIRATKGRGIIISSEASSVLQCRAPADIVNLAAVWGLGQERGIEAITKEARSVVVTARLKRTSYRGVVDIVYGGEKPAKLDSEQASTKRKVAEMSADGGNKPDQQLSKTQMRKKRKEEDTARRAEQEQAEKTTEGADRSVLNVEPSKA